MPAICAESTDGPIQAPARWRAMERRLLLSMARPGLRSCALRAPAAGRMHARLRKAGRWRHPMLGKRLIRPSGFRRQAETGWEAGLAFWKALCAAAGKRQAVRAERTRLLKGETGTGLCNMTERE